MRKNYSDLEKLQNHQEHILRRVKKKEQRPSIITDSEYDILVQHIPNSVIKLQNQTFKAQTFNLCCRYENIQF